ncbi:MarR family transcriptional regulator [Sphaerisporangium album]|uniref:MarR family transcriptional regulator n=1 Tax=Sphaerisporangium album TaxID=509200 RepID=A0A367FKP2_9ACTN|nr:MarR family transcriptional regulator [Sphaerisporangium album]RCG30956.1 MarR family transcriptional regulator [Sphaerisporangium album]
MGEVRWLDDDEQRMWRTFLWASRLLHESLDRQLQRDARMPHTYYVILAMLSEAPDRSLTMSELARLVQSSPSRLSHAVAKLEAQGWVSRCKRPGDARTNLARLTDEGYAVLVEAAPGHVEEVRRVLFDHLSPEQVRQLQAIFESVLAGLTSGNGD